MEEKIDSIPSPLKKQSHLKVLNLSKRKINDSELSLLCKGLKFTPTPAKNHKQLKTDLMEFSRKLKLTEFFHSSPNMNITNYQEENDSIVKNKSNFVPTQISNFLSTSMNYLENIPLKPDGSRVRKSNISLNERKAIKSLKSDKSIIIKEADKGSTVVIMDKEYYLEKILNMLNNSDTYILEDKTSDLNIQNKIVRLINKFNLTKDEKLYLTKFDYQRGNFYGLPKLHKSDAILTKLMEDDNYFQELYCPADLTFRPICAGPISVTCRLSNFIDILIKPMVLKVESYIKDSHDFLRKLPKTVEPDSILVSLDIKNLYSNITHELGIEAMRYWLLKLPNAIPGRISIDFILLAIDLILKNNIFKFNNASYSQIKGTAMGTKFAPSYATLVLGYIEEVKLYPKMENVFGVELASFFKSNYKRYLDDCFFIWRDIQNSLNIILEIFNNLDKNLEYTMEYNDSKLNFLDITIIKNKSLIETDIYYKTTDSHQYLNFTSCHPSHTKRNIPYSLMKRISEFVSNYDTMQYRFKQMKEWLLEQSYPEKLIDDSIKKAKTENAKNNDGKEQPIRKELKEKQNLISFVTSHNTNNPNIHGTVKMVFENLQKCTETQLTFKDKAILTSKRQENNLKKQLTKASFSEASNKSKVTKCKDKRCGTCEHLIEGEEITINGMKIKINFPMTCASENVIYYLQCSSCQLYYIGETGGMLRRRVSVHKQQIKDEKLRDLKVSRHIAVCAKDKSPKFRIMPICKMFSTITNRKAKEISFIEKFNPMLNAYP